MTDEPFPEPPPAEPAPPLDLAAIMAASPPRRSARLELAAVDFGAFGVGEWLELARVLELEPDAIAPAMRDGSSTDKARVGIGVAWLIARRAEPELTYAEVERWSIEIVGAAVGPTPPGPEPSAPSATDSPMPGPTSS